MTDLVPYQPTDSWVPVLTSVGDLAGKLAQTEFVPRALQRKPASVAAAILTGREMGLGPMASLRGIDVIEGRPSLTAQMLAARILAAGHRIEWVAATDKQCTVRIERGDGLSTAEATWTINDAQRAGLAGKKVWQQYPRHMLRARALSECAAMACPDVALGLDVQDTPENGQERPQGATTTVSVSVPQPVAETPVLPALASQVTVGREDDDPLPVTQAQLRKLNTQLGEYERLTDRLTDRKLSRDERRDMIRGLVGLDALDSAKDLTKDQASLAINALDHLIGDLMEPAAQVVDAELMEPEPTDD